MPSRTRGIGPEISRRVAANLQRERTARGLTRAGLAARVAVEGYTLSAATIMHIELGIPCRGERRIRIISVDELTVLAQVLGISEMTLLAGSG